jgi:hypothetical protein
MASIVILNLNAKVRTILLINGLYIIFGMSRKKTFYILMISGIAFILIGGISMIDSNIPRKVSLSSTLDTNRTDVITPIMNNGSTGKIVIDGSKFNFNIEDPNKSVIISVTNQSHYEYDLVANNEGQYKLETRNIGDKVLKIDGEVETKASPLALGGQLMLLITGIIVLGIGMKAKFA